MRNLTFKSFLFLLICMMGVKANADEFNIDGIYYKLNKTHGTASVICNPSPLNGYKYGGAVNIPENVIIDGISYTVTSIGYQAFSWCSGLTSVTIPNSVTSIGDNAFEESSDLTSINIPNSVTSIGDRAFDGTAWYSNQPNGLVYAGNVAYKYKGSMPENTSLSIKEGTLSIHKEAFKDCSGLTSITIPNSVTSIGDYAFSGCSGLTSIEIPNSVTSIGKCAFNNTGWYNAQSEDILYLDNWLIGFKGSAPTGEITIKNGIRGIADNAFEGSSGLTNITIPNSVTSIGNWTFAFCSGLTSITIPNSVTSIGDYAFSNCI